MKEKIVMKKWNVLNPPIRDDGEMLREFGDFFGGIMLRRGITSLEAAKEFFSCESLSEPLLMKDMGRAVEVIREALDSGKRITVYGDYDCDGVTAAAILYSYLEAQGADVDYYIPERSEGYGMNDLALEKLINLGTELIITVDNGISAIEEAKLLREKGVELVVTDHHRPGTELPCCAACVDPNRADDASPFKDLCGAGVVLKLLIALEEDEEFVLDTYAHLAAVGTVGDVMPLKGENRRIVRRGLENIRNEQNAGLSALIRAASREPERITSTDIAFTVCPRINAAGRLGSADKAVRLLLCEDDRNAASRIAQELSELNAQRKSIEDKILSEAEAQIQADPLLVKQRVIVLSGEGWHHGVTGIVCARLLEKYDRPVIMMSIENGEARGSMRSIDGFSAHRLLMECSEHLTKFGGHSGAGGFSLPADKVAEFTESIHRYTRENSPKMPEASLDIDMETAAAALTPENVRRLSDFEPFGERNSIPIFLLKGCVLKSKRPVKDGRFTSFEVTQGKTTLRGITFKIPFAKFYPNVGASVDIVAAAEINEYNGYESVQLRLVDYRLSSFREDRAFAAGRVYEEISRGEGFDRRLLPRIVPNTREQLMAIYDIVRKANGAFTPEELALQNPEINLCMLRVTLDAFFEAKMLEYKNGCPITVPAPQKRDLFKEGLLARLNNV